MKYVPYTTVCIDDERGSNWLTEYDDDNMYDTLEEAEKALWEVADQSDGAYGIFVYDGGKRVDELVYSDSEDYDDAFDEVGFNPYMGCYDYDC